MRSPPPFDINTQTYIKIICALCASCHPCDPFRAWHEGVLCLRNLSAQSCIHLMPSKIEPQHFETAPLLAPSARVLCEAQAVAPENHRFVQVRHLQQNHTRSSLITQSCVRVHPACVMPRIVQMEQLSCVSHAPVAARIGISNRQHAEPK